MDNGLTIVSVGRHDRLAGILEYALGDIRPTTVLPDAFSRADFSHRRILFAVSADAYGMAEGMEPLLARLRRDPAAMAGSTGAVLLDGASELYTKSTARALLFDANRAGCAFLPRSLVEATERLQNFDVLSGLHSVDRRTVYRQAAQELVRRLLAYAPARTPRPNVLLLHASNRASSNTLALGLAIAERLSAACDVTELSLQDSAVYDCNGCSYRACAHFANRQTCFYGGVLPERVFPAIERCDAMLLCCPNYNDAPGAHFLALNNRLNALMLRDDVARERALFAVVASGYSGGDLVAKQLLGGYCLNKPFSLPPRFALLETANRPGAAMRNPGISERLDDFAAGILRAICEG